MKAVILAGGKGTRMMPLTADRPKPMILVNGKPFIEYLIEDLHMIGIKEIGVIVNYKREVIAEYLNEKYPEVVLIDQNDPKGTGHAVLCAIDFVGEEDFIVLMGDVLYSRDDIEALSKMKGSVVSGLEVDNPSAYGVLMIDGNKLISIIEKPQNPPSNLVNAGLYRFTSEVFAVLKNINLSPRGEYEVTDAINMLARAGKMYFYKLSGHWLDFGKPSDVQVVENFLNASK